MTFDELRKADYRNPTVVLFYGLACAPCERLKPKVKTVCEALGLRLEMFNSATELPALRELGIRTVPTVVMVQPNGSAKVVWSGDGSADQLATALELAR